MQPAHPHTCANASPFEPIPLWLLAVQMVVAPGSALTQRSVRSNLPLVLLAVAYGAVLLASWSTDTLHLMMPGSLEEGLKGKCSAEVFVG